MPSAKTYEKALQRIKTLQETIGTENSEVKLALLKKQIDQVSHGSKSEPAWSKRRRAHFMKKAQSKK